MSSKSHAPRTARAGPDQLDSAWKCALDCQLAECLAMCFPAIAAQLDLSRPAITLDTELHQPAAFGPPDTSACRADRLLRCSTRAGGDVCLHVEVQCQRDEHFAERMFIYHALAFLKYRLPVISLAILGDECAAWRPAEFAYRHADCALSLRFATVKLLDLEPALAGLLRARSGFALLVAAHLKTMKTKREPFARLLAKCRLTATLLAYGWDKARQEQMLELLDRLMHLPASQDASYRLFIRKTEGKIMRTLMERLKHDYLLRVLERGKAFGARQGQHIGREQGREEGRRAILIELLERRFGPLPPSTQARLERADPDQVRRWSERFCQANSLEELLG